MKIYVRVILKIKHSFKIYFNIVYNAYNKVNILSLKEELMRKKHFSIFANSY